MSRVRKVNVPGLTRLPAFCHATIVDDQVFVAGVLGADPATDELAGGGVTAETEQTMRNMATVLAACGCTFADVAKVNVYLTDMGQFAEMNRAYLAFMGEDPPARITVGCAALALGAMVEMDCIAFLPAGSQDAHEVSAH